MNRDDTLKKFSQGKEAWNAWADDMKAERILLKNSGQWQPTIQNNIWLEGKNDATKKWLRDATAEFPSNFPEGQVMLLFSDFVFPGPARFDGATFSAHASFSGAKSLGPAWFKEAKFSDDAVFHGRKFSGPAFFNRAMFSGDAWFEEAKFSLCAWGDAQFEGATFSGRALFNWAQFKGDATFESAKFL